MTEQRDHEAESREAIFAKITETANAIDLDRGISSSSGAILKDLAEAWAWLHRPNQPH